MLRAIRWPTLLGLVVVASMVLAACAPAATPAPAVVPPTEMPTVAAPTEVPPTAVPPTTAPATNSPVATPPTTGGQGGGATVQVTSNATLGQILVDNKGMTLYEFKNDKPGQSNCTDTCAQNWPPLMVATDAQPTASADIAGTLAVIQRSDSSSQVTINDMPLYYFKNDAQPGDTKGQGVGNNWYVVSPAGTMITTTATAAPTAMP